jgi:hypothetical protein
MTSANFTSIADSPTRWSAVIAAYAAGVIASACSGKMSPALPMLQAEFGLSLVRPVGSPRCSV